MFNTSSLKTTFKKEDILKKLKDNRAKHEATYKSMRDQYKTDMTLELKQLAAEVANGKIVKRCFNTVPPKAYLKEYDKVIGLLEASTEEVITMDIETYDAWVNDNWPWREEYRMSNSSYMPSSSDDIDG